MNLSSPSERLAQAMAMTFRHGTAGENRIEPSRFSIAISREAGAKGATIASALGSRLGWPVYDRELLQMVADQMKLRAGLLEGIDEKRKSWLTEFVEAFTSDRHVSATGYVHHLLETMLSLSTRGQCIIVGRGAAQVLPPGVTLRVRFIAERPDRIEHLRGEYNLTPDAAARKMETMDVERAQFVRDYFHKDPGDPGGYDLIVNTSRFSVPDCVELVVEALRSLENRATVKMTERLESMAAGV